MKILKQVSKFGATVFEVPASMRTISIGDGDRFDRYHLCLPKMRFMSITTRFCDFYELNGLYGVFLGDDGKVYPMMLNDVSKNGSICLGNTNTVFTCSDLEELTNEIYSRFIQSHFSNSGGIMNNYFLYCKNHKQISSTRLWQWQFMNNFYSVWSSRGRNYDICSDIEVEFMLMLQQMNSKQYSIYDFESSECFEIWSEYFKI